MDFIRWLVDNKIQFSKNLQVPTAGQPGLFLQSKVKANDVVLQVPKSTILSPRTCGIANLLEDLPDMLALSCAYLFEKLQGSKSPWAALIQSVESLKAPDIPRLWSKEEQALFHKSDLRLVGGLGYSEFHEGFSIAADLFEENYLDPVYCVEFLDAYLRMAGLAVFVDEFHALALVPGLHLVRHTDVPNAQFEAEDNVCPLCGKIYCGCREFEAESLNEQEHDDKNGSDDEDEVNEDEDDEDDEEQDDDEDEDYCEIRVLADSRKGQELTVSLQETNTVLISRYGQAIKDNKNEFVNLSRQISAFVKDHDYGDRLAFWKKQFQKFDEEAEAWEEPLVVEYSGVPSAGLEALMAILSLDPRKYFLFTQTGKLKSTPRGVKRVYNELVNARLEIINEKIEQAKVIYQSHDSAARLPIVLNYFETHRSLLTRALDSECT